MNRYYVHLLASSQDVVYIVIYTAPSAGDAIVGLIKLSNMYEVMINYGCVISLNTRFTRPDTNIASRE